MGVCILNVCRSVGAVFVWIMKHPYVFTSDGDDSEDGSNLLTGEAPGRRLLLARQCATTAQRRRRRVRERSQRSQAPVHASLDQHKRGSRVAAPPPRMARHARGRERRLAAVRRDVDAHDTPPAATPLGEGATRTIPEAGHEAAFLRELLGLAC